MTDSNEKNPNEKLLEDFRFIKTLYEEQKRKPKENTEDKPSKNNSSDWLPEKFKNKSRDKGRSDYLGKRYKTQWEAGDGKTGEDYEKRKNNYNRFRVEKPKEFQRQSKSSEKENNYRKPYKAWKSSPENIKSDNRKNENFKQSEGIDRNNLRKQELERSNNEAKNNQVTKYTDRGELKEENKGQIRRDWSGKVPEFRWESKKSEFPQWIYNEQSENKIDKNAGSLKVEEKSHKKTEHQKNESFPETSRWNNERDPVNSKNQGTFGKPWIRRNEKQDEYKNNRDSSKYKSYNKAWERNDRYSSKGERNDESNKYWRNEKEPRFQKRWNDNKSERNNWKSRNEDQSPSDRRHHYKEAKSRMDSKKYEDDSKEIVNENADKAQANSESFDSKGFKEKKDQDEYKNTRDTNISRSYKRDWRRNDKYSSKWSRQDDAKEIPNNEDGSRFQKRWGDKDSNRKNWKSQNKGQSTSEKRFNDYKKRIMRSNSKNYEGEDQELHQDTNEVQKQSEGFDGQGPKRKNKKRTYDPNYIKGEGEKNDPKRMMKMVKRREWGSSKTKWGLGPPLKFPVTDIFCVPTNKRRCFTLKQCTRELLYLQERHMCTPKCPDIKYSFFIGSDGTVYECRGWRTRPGLPKGYEKMNKTSLFIAFAGQYNAYSVPPNMINGRDYIIEYGLRHKMIDKNYKIRSDVDHANAREREDDDDNWSDDQKSHDQSRQDEKTGQETKETGQDTEERDQETEDQETEDRYTQTGVSASQYSETEVQDSQDLETDSQGYEDQGSEDVYSQDYQNEDEDEEDDELPSMSSKSWESYKSSWDLSEGDFEEEDFKQVGEFSEGDLIDEEVKEDFQLPKSLLGDQSGGEEI